MAAEEDTDEVRHMGEMAQRLFNELQQRVIKSLLVRLTGSPLRLFTVSLSIVRHDISQQAPHPHLPPPYLTSPQQQMLH